MSDDWNGDEDREWEAHETFIFENDRLADKSSYGHFCDEGCEEKEYAHDFRVIDFLGIALQTVGNMLEVAGRELGDGLRILAHEIHCVSTHQRLARHHRESRQIMIDYLKTTKEGPDE